MQACTVHSLQLFFRFLKYFFWGCVRNNCVHCAVLFYMLVRIVMTAVADLNVNYAPLIS